MYIILCTFLLVISSNVVLAGVFNLSHFKEEFPSLHENFELLSDSEGKLTIDELSQGLHSGRFEPYAKWSEKGLQSGTVYWAKITLQSQLDRYSEWVLFTGSNNYVDVYVQSVVGFKLKKAGFYDDLEEKDIKEGRESKVSISINSGESKAIYIRYANIGGNMPLIKAELVQPSVFSKKIQWRNLFQGAFQGIMAIFFFYNLLIFLLNRDKTYLYYSFYIFVSGLYFFNWAGFTREYLVKDGIVIWQSIWIYAIALQPTFYIWFMRSFLTTPKLLPKWDKFFKIVPWVMVGGLVIQLVMYYTTFSVKLIANVTMIQTLISYVVMLLCLFIIIFKTRSTLAVYFTIGSLALWIGVFMGTFLLLVLHSGVGGSFVSWAQTGIVAEVILFSLGLGYRMKKNEEDKRKAQEGLIVQLETNQELQTKVNRLVLF